jgi:hypothetical protein
MIEDITLKDFSLYILNKLNASLDGVDKINYYLYDMENVINFLSHIKLESPFFKIFLYNEKCQRRI